ncbi:MAG: hypothetical protein DWH97_07905, partial [Planctomycetota bacterium]
ATRSKPQARDRVVAVGEEVASLTALDVSLHQRWIVVSEPRESHGCSVTATRLSSHGVPAERAFHRAPDIALVRPRLSAHAPSTPTPPPRETLRMKR